MVLDTKLPPLVRDLDNVGPGEEEDFRLVTVDGNTTIRGTDQNKGVVFILRERERERKGGRGREEGGGGGEAGKRKHHYILVSFSISFSKGSSL